MLPCLQFDLLSSELDGFDFEVDSNRRDECVVECVIGEPEQDAEWTNVILYHAMDSALIFIMVYILPKVFFALQPNNEFVTCHVLPTPESPMRSSLKSRS